MSFLDVRGLEPPQPMVKVAKALEELKEGEVLEVLGSRPFTHLLPRLQELGYSYELEEREEGYLLRIWRSGEPPSARSEEKFEINEETNVGKLLEKYPEALNVLIRYGFAPLKNPLLRKILPYTVSLKQAKRIKRMSDEKFEKMLDELRELTKQRR